jgi:hypothetical protein
MNAIIQGILARIQRDQKVILHHFIFEGSHAHIVCTAQDALLCQRFYGELQKQLTDAIKRLTGIRYLSLWERRTNVNEIPTLEDAIEKISYVYTNPSNDALCNHIGEYPGVDTWNTFRGAPSTVEACVLSSYAWIQQPHILKLPSRSLSDKQDKAILGKMLLLTKEHHELRIYPNSWLKCFINNPSYEDVVDANKKILSQVQDTEAANAKARKQQGKGVVGVSALKSQPLLKPHSPKKRGRKIFVQSMSKAIRIALIRERKLIESLCREVYRRWVSGDFSACWPPGTFPPPLPPMASAI